MSYVDLLDSPHLRARVYSVLGWVGLSLLAFGAGLGSLAAFNVVIPIAVLAGYAAVNAVYGAVAGAFNFVARSHTPDTEAKAELLVWDAVDTLGGAATPSEVAQALARAQSQSHPQTHPHPFEGLGWSSDEIEGVVESIKDEAEPYVPEEDFDDVTEGVDNAPDAE